MNGLTDREQQYVERVIDSAGGRRRFRIQQCYRNAQLLMTFDEEKRFRYWEGFIQTDGEIPHAWVTINGKIVDLTQDALKRRYRKLKLAFEPCAYIPVVSVNRLILTHRLLQTLEYGPVFDERELMRRGSRPGF